MQIERILDKKEKHATERNESSETTFPNLPTNIMFAPSPVLRTPSPNREREIKPTAQFAEKSCCKYDVCPYLGTQHSQGKGAMAVILNLFQDLSFPQSIPHPTLSYLGEGIQVYTKADL